MKKTVIDRLYNEHKELAAYLLEAGEPSLVNSVDASFRKALLLSAASYFEVQIRECILTYVAEQANNDEAVISFLKNKAVERQYHSYFDWKQRQANQFFSLFGAGFKEYMQAIVKQEDTVKQGVVAFMQIGELRNLLVHQDFAAFAVETTVDEIYDLYCKALAFVTIVPSKLRDYRAQRFATLTTPSPSE